MDWRRVEPTIVSKVGWRVIVSKTYIQPNDAMHHYQTTGPEGGQCAAVIALTKDKKVIIARQYRPGPEKMMDELPGGGVEPGEDPDKAVARELLEETGYEAGDITLLGSVYKEAYNNHLYSYFLATDCVPHKDGQQTEETEHIDVKLISIDQLLKSGREGKMTDTEALFLGYEKLLKLRG